MRRRNCKRKSHEKAWVERITRNDPNYNTKDTCVMNIVGRFDAHRHDVRTELALWILQTNEEYFYEHSIQILVSHRRNHELNFLRLTRFDPPWKCSLKDIYRIGKGNFGTVYKATDSRTNKFVAIKEITLDLPEEEEETEESGKYLRYKIASILAEKDALIRSNNGVYVVQFLGSFQDNQFQSFWLVFEYCIGTLKDIFNKFTDLPTVDNLLEGKFMAKMYKDIKKKYKFDYEYMSFVYIYELSSGLCYLANRKLIHNDLKPENILITDKGHLKITDFGAVQRMRWLNRFSTMDYVDVNKFESNENKHQKNAFFGTIEYSDPESLVYHNIIVGVPLDEDRFRAYCNKGARKNFLCDIYGGGMIFLETLLLGFQINRRCNFSEKVKKQFNMNRNVLTRKSFLINIIYQIDFHKNYLSKIIDNLRNCYNEDVLDYILSIFEPRATRATEYTKDIDAFYLHEFKQFRALDQERIDDIKLFKDLNFTNGKVQTIQFEKGFFKFINEEKEFIKVAENFHELVESTNCDKTNHLKQHIALTALNIIEAEKVEDVDDFSLQFRG